MGVQFPLTLLLFPSSLPSLLPLPSSFPFPFPSLPLFSPLPPVAAKGMGNDKLPQRVRGESAHQMTLGAFGAGKSSGESNFSAVDLILHQRMKLKRFDGEKCKSEANFNGCYSIHIFPMDAPAPKHRRRRGL